MLIFEMVKRWWHIAGLSGCMPIGWLKQFQFQDVTIEDTIQELKIDRYYPRVSFSRTFNMFPNFWMAKTHRFF